MSLPVRESAISRDVKYESTYSKFPPEYEVYRGTILEIDYNKWGERTEFTVEREYDLEKEEILLAAYTPDNYDRDLIGKEALFLVTRYDNLMTIVLIYEVASKKRLDVMDFESFRWFYKLESFLGNRKRKKFYRNVAICTLVTGVGSAIYRGISVIPSIFFTAFIVLVYFIRFTMLKLSQKKSHSIDYKIFQDEINKNFEAMELYLKEVA